MKILVDRSVWIDHFRTQDHSLSRALLDGLVVLHPHVIGELSLGSLQDRMEIIAMLMTMPRVIQATDEEVLALIERRQLFSKGIGFTDAHLLASVLIDSGTQLWTNDRRLHSLAHALGRAYGNDP